MVESATARLHRRPDVPTGLPWNLTALLESMTDPEPAGRPTAEAVAAAVRAEPDAATGRATRPRHALRRRARGIVPVLIAATLLLACLLGGASLLVATAGPTESSPSAPVSPTPQLATPPAAPLVDYAEASQDALVTNNDHPAPLAAPEKGKGRGGADEKGGGRGNGTGKHDT
jgi:hypothetical protein